MSESHCSITHFCNDFYVLINTAIRAGARDSEEEYSRAKEDEAELRELRKSIHERTRQSVKEFRKSQIANAEQEEMFARINAMDIQNSDSDMEEDAALGRYSTMTSGIDASTSGFDAVASPCSFLFSLRIVASADHETAASERNLATKVPGEKKERASHSSHLKTMTTAAMGRMMRRRMLPQAPLRRARYMLFHTGTHLLPFGMEQLTEKCSRHDRTPTAARFRDEFARRHSE